MPWMWIIAGPNGAGKSTFTNRFIENLGKPGIKKLNADETTAALRAADTTTDQRTLNLYAAKIIDAEVEQCICAGEDFLVETVLSSPKYRDDLSQAKTAGFKTGLIYISLHPAALSPARVRERVQKGGHDVDPDIAIQRYYRSHHQLAWFACQVDRLLVFDNSAPDGAPILLASKGPAETLRHYAPGINPEVDDTLLRAFPESRGKA